MVLCKSFTINKMIYDKEIFKAQHSDFTTRMVDIGMRDSPVEGVKLNAFSYVVIQ